MLGEFVDHQRVFIEVTKTSHQHGGQGWEFGSCLWSPTRSKSGQDIYKLMRECRANDLVLHILEGTWEGGPTEQLLIGRSFVNGPHAERTTQPPSPGNWANQSPYYRVPLRDYAAFPDPVSLEAFIGLYEQDLRKDLKAHPTYYPFTLYARGSEVRLRQGGYINQCTSGLFGLVQTAIGESPAAPGTSQTPPPSVEREFKETKRLARERYAFARNPALVREAKALRGYTCEACGFNFLARYGALGQDYIECHHVDPLGERDEPTTSTRVENVRMVCSNCHKMIHRKRPALTVEQLRSLLIAEP